MKDTIQHISIALAGNPNSGKTTIFNALTGAHHKVGNYPGVTVEKRNGSKLRGNRSYDFTDLPGIYSLTAYSVDEMVARDFLLDQKPDIVIDVMDSTNLARHLNLCLQFQELGIPVIAALNMSDEAEAKGIAINEKQLSSILGIPMVKTVGSKSAGMDALFAAIDKLLDGSDTQPARTIQYGSEIEEKLAQLQSLLASDKSFCNVFPARWLAVKLLEKDSHAADMLARHLRGAEIMKTAHEAAARIDQHFNKDSEIVISEQRCGYIKGALKETLSIRAQRSFSLSESIDSVIMNRFLAFPIFVGILWLVFQLTFTLGAYPQEWLETFFGWLTNIALTYIPAGFIQSLISDGILAGVGGVFSFVPLIIILFFLLSLLEDTGYMARAAFTMDKILHSFGLHGQSMLPMMLGFGCSVPAIMGARTLKSPRDRIVTVLVIPFMSCGAKLPVYVLLAAAFFPGRETNMIMLIYGIGVALALMCALALKKTVLRGEATPFVMELPPYRVPTAAGVLWHVWEKFWHYVKKAGTIILLSSIFIWVITSFPAYEPDEAALESARASYMSEHPDSTDDDVEARLEAMQAEEALEHSIAGTIGKFIEPAARPLGFNWKIGVASITGLAAKEVVVSTLGVLYSVGRDENEESEKLMGALRSDPEFTPLVAFVLMIFTLIVPPCFAALSVIRAELGWKWLGFSFVSLLSAGWIIGALTYWIGSIV